GRRAGEAVRLAATAKSLSETNAKSVCGPRFRPRPRQSEARKRYETFRLDPPMKYTRRTFVLYGMGAAACLGARRLAAQGVSTHTAKPLARPAPSGRPFNARFVDVAPDAGLQHPVLYGVVESKKDIVHATGCGCVFTDFDNAGRIDILMLAGRRVVGK